MKGFDKTITIYNQRYDAAAKTTLWPKQVINGASWAGFQKMSAARSLGASDGYNVRILAQNMPSGFLPQNEYQALAQPQGHWTAQSGDVVVLGVGPDVVSGIAEITGAFANHFTVTAVHLDCLARALPHLWLEGK